MEKQGSSTSISSHSKKCISNNNNKFHSCIISSCDYFYDLLSGFISLLDVITDIMILYYYHKTGKDVFFYLSLCILMFAQLSYAILFIIRFASHLKIRYKLLTFFLILPFCPFMSYIFYWASLQNNKLSIFLECIGLKCSEYEPPSEKQAEKLGITKLQEYFAEKIVNHTGFVLEAICESFPQSILQCIAMIMYYNENYSKEAHYYNVLTFISILISLISISSKSLMFSGSLNISTFFFNWLCAICDFFTLYLIFVWVFFAADIDDVSHDIYNNNNNNNYDHYQLTTFAYLWIWKFIICTVIPIVVGTIILSIFLAVDLYDDITLDMYQESICEYLCKFCIIIGIIILVVIIWSFSVVLLIIFGEVLCCTWIAIGFYYYNESRFSHSRTFMKIFYWLYLSKDANDLLTRLISINYRLSHRKMMNDQSLHKFLNTVIKNDLRFNTEIKQHGNNDDNNDNNDNNPKLIMISDKDPDLFDNLPIDSNICTTNMLFESADDYDKQQKQLSDYYDEYDGGIGDDKLSKNFGKSLLNMDDDNDPQNILQNCGINSLKDITFKDFRIRCKNKHKTHLISVIIKQMVKAIHEDKQRIAELNQQQTYVYGINVLEIRIAKLIVYIQLIADYILWFIFIPLYAISRIFNLLIPIIGCILIQHIKYIQFFQWILTALFFILFIGLIILFPSVWKFQFLAWHVGPGYRIISPKIHNDNTINHDDNNQEEEYNNYHNNNNNQEEEEYTTTLEEILSNRSSEQNSSANITDNNNNNNNGDGENKDDDENKYDDNKEEENEENIINDINVNDINVNDTSGAQTNIVSVGTNNNRNGTRRARRIRRKHRRQKRKETKKKLKKIREKIRKYEKLEFYEWVKEFYYKCISIPMVRTQINDKFGTDIGSIILSYLPSIIDEHEDDNLIMKEVVIDDCDISKTISDSYNDPLRDYYGDQFDGDHDCDINNNSFINDDDINNINVMDFYSENGTANTSHHTTNSNSIIEDNDNPLLFLDDIHNISNTQSNVSSNNKNTANTANTANSPKQQRKNTQSLLCYDDFTNLTTINNDNNNNNDDQIVNDHRDCKRVNLTSLYNDNDNDININDNNLFELTSS